MSRCRSCLVLLGLALAGMPLAAQIKPLNDERLALAMAGPLPLNGLLVGHDLDGPDSRFAVDDRMRQEAPFTVLLETPYLRAHIAAEQARQRFLPDPVLSIDELNAKQVVVHVMPGRNFQTADSIQDVVIKRGDRVVRPLSAEFKTVEILNNFGATRPMQQGAFTFPLEVFDEQHGAFVLVCIGTLRSTFYPAAMESLLSMK